MTRRLCLYATAALILATMYAAIYRAELAANPEPDYRCEGNYRLVRVPDYTETEEYRMENAR